MSDFELHLIFGNGATFVDRASGLCFEGRRPAHRPDLWSSYLEGALRRYRHHGVEAALQLDAIADGATTSLMWVALDADRVVAGLRVHGPLRSSSDAAALQEFAHHPDLAVIEHEIDTRLPYGVIEIKGVWTDLDRPDGRELSSALARCYVHSLNWFGARFALCTASDHALARWASSGGRALDSISPIGYPDERYRTVVLWWDRDEIASAADPDQLRAIQRETAELWVTGERVVPARAPIGDQPPTGDPRRELGAGVASAPLVLHPGRRDDAELIDALLSDPTVRVLDHLGGQIEELAALLPEVDPAFLAEAPRWVFYPWRSCMVRVLGPGAFRRVRLDRNRNKITEDEQAKLARLRIGVVGLSVGHVIAHALALEGLCGELRLADFDAVELSNLNRIPASVLDLGLNKAVVAARRIAELDPYLEVSVAPTGVSAESLDEFLDGLDLVIEECDSLDVKLLVREAARRRRIPVVMETSDRGMLDVERFDLEPSRALFHGLVDDLRADDLRNLSTHDKVPFVLQILEPEQLSARMAASMAEIDHTVTTWPQLGGDVTLGAATVAAAVRRFGREEALPSGRLRVDLHDSLARIEEPPPPPPLLSDESTVPEPAPVPDALDAVVRAANLAPSGGNTQPWRFEIDDRELRVHLVRERTSTLDAEFRGSYVAIGAALFNARVAAASFARLGEVELLPAGLASDHVATLRFGDEIDLALAEMYPDMLARCSNRHEGTPQPIGEATAELLRAEARREGGDLVLVTDRPAIGEAAELLSESDRLRYLSPWLHREMMAELRWPGRDALETGIDVRTLELDASDLAKLAVARRADVMGQLASWDTGRALGDVTRERVGSSSALAVVTVEETTPAAYLRGGSAVERVWISAQRNGLAVQPVSPIFIFASEQRDFEQLVPPHHVEHLVGLAADFRSTVRLPHDAAIALVLRLSHAPAPTFRSARLPVPERLSVGAARPTPTQHHG